MMMSAVDWDISDLDVPEFEDPPASSPTNGFKRRPYQEEARRKILAGWKTHRKQLLVMSTGTGKTVVFADAASEEVWAGGRVLILAHLGELLEQARDKLGAYGLDAALEKSQDYASVFDKVVLASWQTLHRDARLRGWAQDHFSLIIVDEAHRSMSKGYQKILSYFDKARVLGVTATADRGDKKSLGEYYDAIAYEFGLLAACKSGWLVRPVAKTIPVEIDLSGVKTRRSSEGSDIDAVEVAHRIEPFLSQIAGEIRVEAPNRKHMVFLPTVDTAQKMSDAMNANGFRSTWVSGASDDRDARIEQYRTGAFDTICNCMLLTEGFDCDSIDCVTVLRPTKIRSLLAQCIGRGTRPISDIVSTLNDAEDARERGEIIAASSKPNLLILDFLWLTTRLNLAEPASLVAKNDDMLAQMKKEGDLIDNEEQAERDFLENLKKEVSKHSKKKKRTVDPLGFAVAISDADLADYEPSTAWEAGPPSANALKVIEQFGIDPGQVTCRGQAKLLYDKLLYRKARGLAAPRQLNFLKRIGVDGSNFSAGQAGRLINDQMKKWRARRRG